MIAGVLFDLDETLLDRTGSLVAFLRDQHDRFGKQLGAVAFEPWRDRFLALDARGMVAKSEVYPALLATFYGDPAAVADLVADYQSHCADFARPFEMKNHASLRTIVDFADVEGALSVLSTGQSGQPGARHWGDQVKLWLEGRLKPMPLSRDRIDAEGTLVLRAR